MNLTIATPALPPGLTERRRYTFAGVSGLRLELQDGTQIEITETDGGIDIRSARAFTATMDDDHAVHVSAVRIEKEDLNS